MNLLPNRQRKRIKLQIIFRNIIFSTLILVVLSLVLILVLGGFLIFLNLKYQSIEKKIIIEQSRIIETETVRGMERRVEEINKELRDLQRTQLKQSNLYQALDDISRNLLLDVEVRSLEANESSGKITISGYSPFRENLLAIKKILETNIQYKDINFPLSNLTNPIDIDFQFSFIYEH